MCFPYLCYYSFLDVVALAGDVCLYVLVYSDVNLGVKYHDIANKGEPLNPAANEFLHVHFYLPWSYKLFGLHGLSG